MSDHNYDNYPQMAMKRVFRLGHKVGLFSLWYAAPNIGFLRPGYYLWFLGKNRRIISLKNKDK